MNDDQSTPVRMTLKELVEHYEGFLGHLEQKRAETRGTYGRALREFLSWFPLDRKFQFRRRDVERYRRHLSERRGFTDSSIGTYMTALRQFCRYLVEAGVLETNPARRVIGGRRPERHSRAWLRRAEVATLLEAVDTSSLQGARDMAIIRSMLDCGLSEQECVHADIGDIRTDERGLSTLAVQGKGRSAKDLTVTLTPAAHRAIEEYLGRRFAGEEQTPEAPLFAGVGNRSHGARMTARGMRAAVTRWLESSGVKRGRDHRLTPFSLRHTCGLFLVDSGATVEEVMKRMRIEWPPTAQLYFTIRAAHPDAEE